MNHTKILKISFVCCLFFLTGCWDSSELVDLGYVMGVSVDQTKEGKIEITTHVYAPVQATGMGGGAQESKPPYVNITTIDESVFEAVRDLTINLGRKGQWSHMRSILISEQFARENDVGKVLDFFYRDHEPRLTSLVLITQDKASDYWNVKPFIERTTAQQIRTIQESGAKHAGKTHETNLLDVGINLNYPVKIATIPYIKMKDKETIIGSGLAIIKEGKMVDRISSRDVESLWRLKNEYDGGIIEFPCTNQKTDQKNRNDSFEILKLDTKLSPDFSALPPTINVSVKTVGFIGELQCSSMEDDKERLELKKLIENHVKTGIENVIKHFQDNQVDVIGIGNKLYQQDPQKWKEVEADWDQFFSESKFVINVEVIIKSAGMETGTQITGGS